MALWEWKMLKEWELLLLIVHNLGRIYIRFQTLQVNGQKHCQPANSSDDPCIARCRLTSTSKTTISGRSDVTSTDSCRQTPRPPNVFLHYFNLFCTGVMRTIMPNDWCFGFQQHLQSFGGILLERCYDSLNKVGGKAKKIWERIESLTDLLNIFNDFGLK